MVRIVIIGCGGVAMTRHIPGSIASDHIQLYGFYDVDVERAEKLAEQYSVKAYHTLEELLADPNVDAVTVCTATKFHTDITIKALESGKHVLCEKPMAASVEEAQRMVDAARRTGKKLMISHNQRLYSPHVKAKELIESGAIGKVLTFRTHLGIRGPEYSGVNRSASIWYFDKKKAGRGVVSDVGSHRIDLMRYFFGDIEKVFAYTPTLDKRYPDGRLIDLDDNAFAILQFKNGVVGQFTVSWTSYSGNDRQTQIFGTQGTLTVYGEKNDIIIETLSGETIYYDLPDSAPQDVVLVTDIDERFAKCIENDEVPFVTAEDGLEVVKTIEAMEKSNLTGTWVDIK